jgi:HK97 family phage portal protein
MGIWSSRSGVARRDAGELPGVPYSDFISGLLGQLGGTFADVSVNTIEKGLQVAAVGNAVDLLASICSELPLYAYRGEGQERKQISMPGYLLDPEGEGHGLEDFIYKGTTSWLLRGNLYGDTLDGDPRGQLRQVLLFHPDQVVPDVRSTGEVRWRVNGREYRGEMLHRRAYPVPGVLLGRSVISQYADTLGVNLASTRYGKQWFTDGAHPGGILSNDLADLKDEKVRRSAKDRFMAAVRGNREPVVLGRGWKFEQIQVNPNESQFLETQKLSAAESARLFGPGVPEVLGYESGGTMTYTNMVDRDLAVLKYAANKWLKRWERLLSQFLPRPQYVRFDREAFLETNIVQQWQARKLQLDTGSRTINELRAKDHLPPVPWGDEPMQKAAPAPADPAEDGTDPNQDPAKEGDK